MDILWSREFQINFGPRESSLGPSSCARPDACAAGAAAGSAKIAAKILADRFCVEQRVYVTRFERRVCLDFCICVRAEISVRAKKSKRERNFAPPEVSLCHFRQEFCLSTKAESISKIPLMGHTSRRLLFSCVFGLCTWPTFKSPHERLIYERSRM